MPQCRAVKRNGIECLELTNDTISLAVCPAAGGKIISLKLRETGQELLWNNPQLEFQVHREGAAYDPNFFGGVDELLPNDEMEVIDGVQYPDHGELWTMPLKYTALDDGIKFNAILNVGGLTYEKHIKLDPEHGRIRTDYVLKNVRDTANSFLWKLHAAMVIHEEDVIICPAKRGEIGDEDFTGRKGQRFFDWPVWQNKETGQADRLDVVPALSVKRNEFFFLSELDRGEMRIESAAANTFFEYQFDKNVFPYAWVFATYGGWNGLYTAVLEPCTAVPHVLSKSIAANTCSRLQPGEELRTRVTINVGKLSEKV